MPRHDIVYYTLKLREKFVGLAIMTANFSNVRSFMMLKSGLAQKAVLVPKDRSLDVKSITVSRPDSTITVMYRKKPIVFYFDSDRQLDNTLTNIFETFVEQQYKGLDLDGRVVLDVGANNGDSALYFAFNSARRVYAYEPYPYSCRIARKNVSLNGMQRVVSIVNEAVLNSGANVAIDEGFENVSCSLLETVEGGKRIKTVNMDQLVKRHRLSHAILKMDCEGCEYEVLLGAKDSSLKCFDQVVLEYHYGPEALMKKFRKCGFDVRYQKREVGRKSEAGAVKMDVGIIYADKKR